MFYVGLIAFVVGATTLAGVVFVIYAIDLMWMVGCKVFGKRRTGKKLPNTSDAHFSLRLHASR